MKIEDLFILSLIAIGLVFLLGFARVLIHQRRRKRNFSFNGYQLKRGHLQFHLALVKHYPSFTMAYFPLLNASEMASFSPQGMSLKDPTYKGVACLLEIEKIDEEILKLIRSHFDREEEPEGETITFYQEDLNFMSQKMKIFVIELDLEIEKALKVSSWPIPQ